MHSHVGTLSSGAPIEYVLKTIKFRYVVPVMLSMFLLWIAVFVLAARRSRFAWVVALVNIVWTVVLLKLHMTDPIPLEF